MTPLLTAASIGFMDACELLVDAGADINYIPDGKFNDCGSTCGITFRNSCSITEVIYDLTQLKT